MHVQLHYKLDYATSHMTSVSSHMVAVSTRLIYHVLIKQQFRWGGTLPAMGLAVDTQTFHDLSENDLF